MPRTANATTTFARLPSTLQRPITGGCQCPYCAAHPDKVPHWDTLAIDDKGNSWTVHHPEPIKWTMIRF